MTAADHPTALYRILDAAANRAAEGLRTLEEYARFVLEDRSLTAEAKSIRHELRVALEVIAVEDRWAARAVTSDVGTAVTTDTEMHRDDIGAVVAAAAMRTEQALRCLEEYSKPLRTPFSEAAESLRYRCYSLAATLLLLDDRRLRLADARLYLLIDAGGVAGSDPVAFADRIARLYRAGVDIIQLRDKAADDRTLYRLSRRGAEIARGCGKLFIVNDRADIAAAAAAQGVHVGQDELPVEAVRRVVGKDVLIGVSTHSLEQVRAAVADGADYIGCGPTFPSQTKRFDEYPGLDFLRAVVVETSLPGYAIGGIDETNFAAVQATGIHGVAVAQAILGAADPLAAASEFKSRLG